MAIAGSTIKIKRSGTSGDPAKLGAGELAFSSLAGAQNNGGDRLYIGVGAETAGNAEFHYVIGGKYFTDLLDHVHGTLTASSALIVDSNKKLDELLVDDLSLNGNTLSSTGTLKLQAGTGNTIQLAADNFIAGGSFDGSQVALASNAELKQLRGGTVNLVVGASGTATNTVIVNNDGSLTVPGTIKTLNNGNLTLAPHGTGLVSIANAYTLPRADGTAGYVLTTNGNGTVSFQAASSALSIKDDANNTDSISLLTDTLSILGGEGIDTLVTNNTITISAEDASTSNKGVAKFTATDFTVTSGEVALVANRVKDIVFDGLDAGEGIDITFNTSTHVTTIAAELASTSNAGVASFSSDDFAVSVGGEVTIKTAGVGNAQLENSRVTVGSTNISLGSTSTTLAGLTQVDINNLRLTGSTLSITTGTQELILDPSNGASGGTVNVSNAKITNLATPTADSDAATKAYVDSVAQGLSVKQSVQYATTASLSSYAYDNGSFGVGAIIEASANGALSIDGSTPTVGDRVLVKNETSVNATNNGIYVVTRVGSASIKFKLTRATDFDSGSPSGEIPSAFTFVERGTANADTGWTCVTNSPVTVGTTDIVFTQFSGAGTYAGGIGLTLDGTTFNVNTATGTGLYVSGDTLQIDPTLAGNGLTYNTGVLAVVGTADRITVTADAINIAATYVGQTSITTVGTITSGTWNATTVAAIYGGTGVSSYTTGDILYANSSSTLTKLAAGANGTVLQIQNGVPVWADLDGGTY